MNKPDALAMQPQIELLIGAVEELQEEATSHWERAYWSLCKGSLWEARAYVRTDRIEKALKNACAWVEQAVEEIDLDLLLLLQSTGPRVPYKQDPRYLAEVLAERSL